MANRFLPLSQNKIEFFSLIFLAQATIGVHDYAKDLFFVFQIQDKAFVFWK
jgi:hypothetical protein